MIQRESTTTEGLTDHAAFRDVVLRDVRGQATADERAWLGSQALAARWLDVLVATKQDVEAQMAEREAELDVFRQECYARGQSGKVPFHEAAAKHKHWRAGAIRFKINVEQRIREAKRIKHEGNMERADHSFGQRIADLERRVANLESAHHV